MTIAAFLGATCDFSENDTLSIAEVPSLFLLSVFRHTRSAAWVDYSCQKKTSPQRCSKMGWRCRHNAAGATGRY